MSASSMLAEQEELNPSPLYSLPTSNDLFAPSNSSTLVSPYPPYPHIPPLKLSLTHEAYSIVKIAVDLNDSTESSTTETTLTYVATIPQQTRLKRHDSIVAPHRIYGGPSTSEPNGNQELDSVPLEFREPDNASSKKKLSVKPLDPSTILSFPAHFGPSAGETDALETSSVRSQGQAVSSQSTHKRSVLKPTVGVVTDPLHGDFISYVEPRTHNKNGADSEGQRAKNPEEQDGIDPLYEHLQRLHNGYLPIQDYGVIGNMSTVALVGMDGSIDFFSYPRFDSPTIFARMLDSKKGGFFQITPTEPSTKKQLYLPNSNVLLTRFLAEGGVGQITDLMPLSSHAPPTEANKLPWLLRKVEVVRGEVSFRIDCFPSFDYARAGHTTRIYRKTGEEQNERCTVSELLDDMNACLGLNQSESQKRSCEAWTVGKSTVVFTSNSMRTTCTRACASNENNDIPPPGESNKEFVGRSLGGPSTSYPPEKLDFRMSMDLRHVIHAGEQEPPVLEWDIPPNHVGAGGASGSGPGVSATVTLSEGQSIFLVLREIPPSDLPPAERHVINPPLIPCLLDTLMDDTIRYWRNWANKCTYRGRWREDVMRSVLALKLMQFLRSGAMVAAPTFSLPEGFGGERNWDYRYTWIRDAAFTVYAFMRIGFTEEASGFMRWIELRCRELAADLERPLQIMYGIDGRHVLTEEILSHLDGYRSSRPVRVGNGAYNQLQLDIYGELMDSVYLFNKYGSPIGYDFWVILTKLVEYVCEHWQEKDEGIWEVRGGQQHFIYSKVMSWVAVDRGLRLAEKRSFPAPREKWYRVRDQIYTDIMEKGWSKNLNAFVQAYDNETLDAANLIMPLCFFIGASDPRLFSTLEATMKPPHAGGLVANNLCFRYNVQTSIDGLTGEEGTFSICSFWLVEALTRSGRYHKPHLNQALTMFEQMIGYGNHLGLFGEQLAKTGEAMGNFPQAFTHLALISAAFNLDRVLG